MYGGYQQQIQVWTIKFVCGKLLCFWTRDKTICSRALCVQFPLLKLCSQSNPSHGIFFGFAADCLHLCSISKRNNAGSTNLSPKSTFSRGVNGRPQDVLTEYDIESYDHHSDPSMTIRTRHTTIVSSFPEVVY